MKINFPELCFSLPVLWHCDTPVVMLSYNLTTSSLLEHAVGRLKKSLVKETVVTDQTYLDKLVNPSFLQSLVILSLENSLRSFIFSSPDLRHLIKLCCDPYSKFLFFNMWDFFFTQTTFKHEQLYYGITSDSVSNKTSPETLGSMTGGTWPIPMLKLGFFVNTQG